MSQSISHLLHKDVLIVFTYSPAGLGHLRVTDALYHGLPPEANPIILGSQEKMIRTIHRITSIHPIARAIFEWMQNDWPEKLFTPLYRFLLRTNTNTTYEQFTTIIDQRIELPKTVLVVATHFGLAHQLAAIKDRIIKEKGVNIKLIVQVTDDSPQAIWYIPGADLTFVPSEKTKQNLIQYGISANLPPVHFDVNPYPVSPLLSKRLMDFVYEERKSQLNPEGRSAIRISMPLSGAAVGMEFYYKLILGLYKKSSRFVFNIVSKRTPYTSIFLDSIVHYPFVNLYTSTHDRGVVDQYDRMYHGNVISIEITKPSEQAFKILLKPIQRGGAIMLFASPVGRQEKDNINFMIRHGLIPTYEEQKKLWERARNEDMLSGQEQKELFEKAAYWRGICLPFGSKETIRFIYWCYKTEIFKHMVENKTHCADCEEKKCNNEIQSTGVRDFWIKVANLLNS